MMNGRDIQDKLNYLGMERGIRKLAIREKLEKPEKIAIMSTTEVCDLIAKEYDIFSSESEKLTLVKKENVEKVEKLIERICR